MTAPYYAKRGSLSSVEQMLMMRKTKEHLPTGLDALVITEANCIRKCWDVIFPVLLIYTGTVFPYRLCFVELQVPLTPDGPFYEPESEPFWVAFGVFVDILFWLDLFFNFLFSFTDAQDEEVTVLTRIVKKYVASYFLVDLAACLPPEVYTEALTLGMGFFTPSSGPNKVLRLGRMHRITRLTRLARLSRLVKCTKMQKSAAWRKISHHKMMRLARLVGVLLFVVHLMACGWYLVASLDEDPSTTWLNRRDLLAERSSFICWAHSMYFVLTVFTTVGFGDISALSEAEILYCGVLMIVGTLVNSIVVGNMINVVSSGDARAEQRMRLETAIKEFSEHAKLDETNRNIFKKWAMRTHSEAAHDYDRGAVRKVFTGDRMPSELLHGLMSNLFQGKLVRNDFISNSGSIMFPPSLPLLVALSASECHFQAGETVYETGEFPTCMFLILSGTFANVKEGMPYKLMGMHRYFGAAEMLLGVDMRICRVRSESQTACVVISKEDLNILAQDFPGFTRVWKIAARRGYQHATRMQNRKIACKDYRDFAARCLQREVRRMLAVWAVARSSNQSFDSLSPQRNNARLSLLGAAQASILEPFSTQSGANLDWKKDMESQSRTCAKSLEEMRGEVNGRLQNCEESLQLILQYMRGGSRDEVSSRVSV